MKFVWMLMAGMLGAQTEKFEVASIRPASPDARGVSIHTTDGRLRTVNTSFFDLMVLAYRVQPYQITGATGWMRDERFDINATFDQTEDEKIAPTDLKKQEARDERLRNRVKNLLSERFQLKFREELKELPVFALVVDKTHKLKPPSGEGNMNINQNNRAGKLQGQGVTMGRLSETLSRLAGKPVLNETGLDGLFDVDLEWNDAPGGEGPSLFAALKEQAGLKLDAKKAPVRSLEIEKVERPSEN